MIGTDQFERLSLDLDGAFLADEDDGNQADDENLDLGTGFDNLLENHLMKRETFTPPFMRSRKSQ
jgi:hypothetical protein